MKYRVTIDFEYMAGEHEKYCHFVKALNESLKKNYPSHTLIPRNDDITDLPIFHIIDDPEIIKVEKVE